MGCECDQNKEQLTPGRRKFLSRLIMGIGTGIGGILSIPLIMSVLDPLLRRDKHQWRTVGSLSDFHLGETRKVVFENAEKYRWSKHVSESAAYIRREEGQKLIAFKVNCSHLGCPVRWEKGPQMFFCPCHGGAFYRDGTRAAGPPNRSLYQYRVRVRKGKVELQTGPIPVTNIGA